jgi:hypothetical protein
MGSWWWVESTVVTTMEVSIWQARQDQPGNNLDMVYAKL